MEPMGKVTRQLNLSGIITDQLNGYGTVFSPILNLQNGSPDGSISKPWWKVIQF
jgi:hypothetical protein